MRNVKVMIIIKSIHGSVWQQLIDKLQASIGERKHINAEEVNNKKDEEKTTNKLTTRNYITQSLKYYWQF
jgi:hypothetical protein